LSRTVSIQLQQSRAQTVFYDLKATGLALAGTQAYPDHYAFTAKGVRQISALNNHIAITAEDAVQLKILWPKDQPLWSLQQQGNLEQGLLSVIQSYICHQIKTLPPGTGFK